ncbi:MAG: type II toxin-antitoxin system VapC family toxin [Bacteroidota bacterium]|jgi:predicted nucleic acid-binding protein
MSQRKVLVDTDVCLDLLTGRKPFNQSAELLFSLGDAGKIRLYVSAISFSNLDYILRKELISGRKSRAILSQLEAVVTVLPVGEKTIQGALRSDFNDFEDAIQHQVALENGQSVLITRNLKDYRKANCLIMSPEMFLAN